MATWPPDSDELLLLQQALGELSPERWQPPTTLLRIGGCFVCFKRTQGAGATGDAGFAWAAVTHRRRLLAGATGGGPAGAVPARPARPPGRTPPRAGRTRPPDRSRCPGGQTPRDGTIPGRAGLAVHLGVVPGLPTVGVTTRPLLAEGGWPPDERCATAPLRLDKEVVGCSVRTRPGAKPVAEHAAWRTDASDAVWVVLTATRRARTPEPLRRARTLARTERARMRWTL
jgi:deoxyribonuclease V